MKIRGDVSSVNLSTGEKKEFLVGDGEVRQVPAALHKEGAGGEWVYAKVEHVTEDGPIVARHWRPLMTVTERDAVRREALEEAAKLFEKYGKVYEVEIEMIRALAAPPAGPDAQLMDETYEDYLKRVGRAAK